MTPDAPTTPADGPRLVTTRDDLRAVLADVAPGTPGRRAVVMTMGALHAGHLELVRAARAVADQVVVTIFVNPLQFGPGEDLDRYPRDLEGDLALLAGAGADVVFAPTPDVVYPDGDPVVRVSAGALGDVLEGAARPGHFDGVLTVVLKLLHLVRPQVAMFGQKDAQQLMAVRRMVRDLDVGVEVVGVPIVRDADGLALSSRNAYLSDDERRRALVLSRAVRAAEPAAADGATAGAVLVAAQDVLSGADVELEYAVLEGAARPGHFDGVLTVVLKLLHLVRPDVALFGQKDAQQLMAIRRMVRDLDVAVEVVAVPIVRDADGLALSSRNAYLSDDERRRALVLSRAVRSAEAAARDGGGAGDVLTAAQEALAGAGIDLEYAVLVDPLTAQRVREDHTGAAVLVLAARVGTTRLIDNAPLRLGPHHVEHA